MHESDFHGGAKVDLPDRPRGRVSPRNARKKESDLFQDPALLRFLLDSLDDGVVLIGPHNRILGMNQPAREMLKVPSGQNLDDTRCYEVIFHGTRPCSECHRGVHDRPAPPFSVRECYSGPLDRWYRIKTVAFPAVRGGRIRKIDILSDITKAKKGEKRTLMLEKVLENMADGLTLLDLSGRIVYVNRALCTMFGYLAKDLTGVPVDRIRGGSNPETLSQEIRSETFSGGWSGELVGRRKDGSEFPSLMSSSLVKDSSGRPLVQIEISRDISRIKREENSDLAAERVSAVKTLVFGIAHEFNNILGSMSGYAQLAIANPTDRKVNEKALKLTVDLCWRGKAIVDSLTLCAQRREPKFEVVDIPAALERVLQLEQSALKKDEILVERSYRSSPKIWADSEQISVVFAHLIENARHAMLLKDKKILTLEIGEESDCVVVRISDTGVGIPFGDLKKVFDPFFTTKGSLGRDIFDGKVHGTGLGLSSVRGILNNHGAKITVDSRLGEGTTFTVTFPIPMKTIPPLRSSAAGHGKLSPAFRGKKILVVEDEKDIRDLLVIALSGWGFRVVGMGDGRAGVDRCLKEEFDLVLLDFLMPGMNGDEAFRAIRAARENLPIAFISGWTEIVRAREMLSEGAVGWIQKPFNLKDIRGLILQWLAPESSRDRS